MVDSHYPSGDKLRPRPVRIGVSFKPKNRGEMQINEEMLTASVFLCVEDGGRWLMAGTAFTLCLDLEGVPFCYLVTARHCVRKAERYSGLHARMNRRNEPGYVIEPLDRAWYYPESAADDVAVMLLPNETVLACEIAPMAMSWVDRSRMNVGIGTEVAAIGLFTRSTGKERNRPIARSGTIAAMADVPLEDEASGLPYDGYLVELRSIGGLSGSPVFVLNDDSTDWISLLGLIRGHWNKSHEWTADYAGDETNEISTGIAIVTPIEKAVELITKDEDVQRERRRLLPKWKGTPESFPVAPKY